ncbi:MAG: DNA repair protein RecN [Spirochaetes bacterium]|jgi:DNA repair protein RecN (Recombination protein N)|nr:DNA repair protein RecN [Spirochaetota bacterium]
MLTELRIKNFVIIDELKIPFGAGLNILTGETGAGKSILIDALSGVLGDKMTTDQIRSGFERAALEGVFDVSTVPQVRAILDESGIDCDDGTLVLRREIYTSGKGRCFANATQIPIAKLQALSEYLVDIHGQNEHQNIMRIAKHRETLDSFARLGPLVDTVRGLHAGLSDLKERISSFEIDEKEKARKIEFLGYAIREIEAARLQPNEEEDLRNESALLQNSEKLFTEISASSSLLKGDGGIVQSLKRADQSLSAISGFDVRISSILETVRTSLYSLEDAAADLRTFEKDIQFSPERINQVEERLSLISSLRKKYGTTVREVLDYAEKSKRELDAISSSEEQIEKLKADYRAMVQVARDTALDLSEKRRLAAKDLEEKVMKELADLGMPGTVFRISIKRELSPDGEIETENKRYVLYPHGLDRIEFLLSANEGEDLRQLRKAASGGEMSRIMLAIKKVILSADIVESLVFDEVDAGIGGKTSEVVGKKLKSLAMERQVLVITHLPQIAAMSDVHFTVQKENIGGRVTTLVKKLSRREKVNEVARMLAGEKVTELSVRHAEEMIALAEKGG